MKKRSTEILQKLMKHSSRRYSIPKLARDYGVSQRTLRNDIGEINSFLNSVDMPGIAIGNDGSLEVDNACDRHLVLEEILEMDTYNYRLSSEERQVFLLSTLLCSNGYVSMQDIADELFVSRVTILNDVQRLQDELVDMEIYMISDAGKGMKLICNPRQRIRLMIRIYQRTAVNVENGGFFQNFIFRKMDIKYPFSEVFDHLQEYITNNNIIFIDDTLYDIALYLFAMFNVADQIEKKKRSPLLSNKAELKGMDYFLIYLGFMLEADVTEDMLRFYREYLTENNLHSYVKSVDEMELYKIIHYYLSEIDHEMHLHLTMDSLLIDSLLLHIKNMKNWGGYEVELPKADNIAVDYELLKENVDKYAYVLERFLGYKLSDNMKKSIVIHICVALIRHQRDMSRLSVAVVCPGSMATGKYLESQIRNYFDFNIVGVISASQVFHKLEEQKEQVDFILSTVPLESDKYEVVTVHPFLTMEDLNKIQEISFLCRQKKEEKPSHSKNQLILNKMRNLRDMDGISSTLKTEMDALINEYEKSLEEDKFSAIGELLRQEYIIITYEDLNWRDAMRLSARPLEIYGCATPEYIEVAIGNVEKYGDYIIIGPGIALAHSNSESGALKDGLSLLVCPTGITFSEGESVVYMIFCFVSTGKKEYLEMMKEVVDLSLDKGRFQEMLEMTEEELYELLG